ncbi:ABC transporter substrate-binding protein [Microtetraspora sp. NBRC 16547]|uniref:peptide ABC transporter substrate-binding protein n=1 Tax=Microtetraspora sp. NBRC 16547 TaxID=3030993 RepID=UPI0024A20EA8|nr:ABC transporter substrate-binding protein [Microtetraspora sp. NBRC 16547]GLW97631.1 peptide ABC transporter substrate-binding protein [Microtetraspora sp. NBRC 16547]
MSRQRLAAVAALTLLPCTALGSTAHADSASEITVGTCTPYQFLDLGTVDPCGSEQLDALFTGLTEYEPGTSRSRYAVAESIITKDNQVFHVTLRKGWKFHDGTEVKARNFVEAWNQVASGKTDNSFLFEEIKGYGSRRMSGLKVTGNHTFTITLSRPFSPFVKKLSMLAFSPLPDSTLKNPASFSKKPIGNGPFRVVSWSLSSKSVVERFDDYPGAKPAVSRIVYRVYRDETALYADLRAGDLDFTSLIPSTKLATFKKDLGGRVLNRAGHTVQLVAFPAKVAANIDFRKAVSMAIDRETITREVFGGGRVPAHSFVPPTAEGSRRDSCGQVCSYNPGEARKYLAKALASGFRPPAALPLYYNADSPHAEWVKRVAESVTKTLGGKVKVVPKAMPTFAGFRDAVTGGRLNGMIRAGWQLDYPHIQNVLAPMYASDGVSNDSRYRNPRFDALLRAADRQSSPTKANALYQQAEALLVRDLPAIPLWVYSQQAGYSTRIAKAELTPTGWLDPVTVKLA